MAGLTCLYAWKPKVSSENELPATLREGGREGGKEGRREGGREGECEVHASYDSPAELVSETHGERLDTPHQTVLLWMIFGIPLGAL